MLWDNLKETIWSSELPFATLAPVGLFLLSEHARRFVTVTLNGQGADEVFLGYRSFYREAIADTGSSGQSLATDLRRRRLKLHGLPRRWVDGLSLLIFHEGHRISVASTRAQARRAAVSARPLINRIREARISEMPIDILGFLGDRVEMAHSLEVRVPFLDHKVYEAATAIPVEVLMRENVEKAVLREAARGLLPDSIRARRKLGFMLTSESIDFHGTDRSLSAAYRPYLSKETFARVGLFSWRTYRFINMLARVPAWRRFRALKQLRQNSNKIIMYMLQGHLLHDLFVENPQWSIGREAEACGRSRSSRCCGVA